MLSNKTPLRHRYAMPPLPKERLSLNSAQIQNLQSYELCGILDIEKTTDHKVVCLSNKVLESHFLPRKV